MTQETLEQIDLDKAFAFYQDRLADAGDFHFYFVGNIELDTMKGYIEQYLASLPNLDREETWVDNGIRPPTGKIYKEIFKGKEPKCQVAIRYTGPIEWDMAKRVDLNILQEALQIRLREVLREDLGGTYGVGVRALVRKNPSTTYQVNIDFGCDPARVDELIATVQAQLQDVRDNGLSDEYLLKVRETYQSKHEEDLRSNSYWMRQLQFIDEEGLDASYILDHWGPQMDSATPESIKATAGTYLNRENEATFVLRPEEVAN